MLKHVTVIAYDEGDNPHLWSLQEAGGIFRCMAWELTADEAERLAATRERFGMDRAPNQQEDCTDEGAVREFFAGPIDTVRSSFADHIIENLHAAQAQS